MATILFTLLVAISARLQMTWGLPQSPQKPLQALPTPFPREKHKVPGDSPAYYLGDYEKHILKIDSLDLLPKPPVPPYHDFTLRLRGNITQDIGPTPKVVIHASLNRFPGPDIDSDLCYQKIRVFQNGTQVCPPTQGPVEMTYTNWVIPLNKKGWYTVFVEMYATDGDEVTAFEGDVWIETPIGSGRSGWRGNDGLPGYRGGGAE